ncbi:MAG: PilW family protein [Gammaproteobacteria bacterium]|nr:PilW family protein [Gammaproteobacteria bacterium]
MISRKQQGFSLVELMVAMLLGLIVTAAVIEVFINTKQMYRVQDARSRLQENARYAMYYISEAVRKTGYLGCATRASAIPVTNTLNNNANYLWNYATSVQGVNASGSNVWSPAIDPSITSPLSGSDVLTLRGMDDSVIQVTAHPGGSPPGSAAILVNAGNGLKQFDIVMVTDCLAAAVFQITSANPNTSGSLTHNTGGGVPGNWTDDLGKDYANGEIIKLATTSFYIRNNGDGKPSLYQRVNNNGAQELIQNVEQMQVLYGVDTGADGAADQYVMANNVTNWADVISVRVSLLLRTDEDNLTVDGPQTYNYNGATITASDNRLRTVVSKTITLRNRVP